MFSSRNRNFIVFWGLPQILFISVSLLFALSVGADFGHNTFVKVIVFFVVWMFINMSYYLCQSIFYTLLSSTLFRSCNAEDSKLSSSTVGEKNVIRNSVNGEIYDCLSVYAVRKMLAYLDDENLNILLEDIRLYILSPFPEKVKPVRTKVPVHPRDLKHFIWNIGIRLNYSSISKATFVKQVFAEGLRSQSLETILRTLRQDGKCLIELDYPKPGSFRFSDDG